MKYQEAKELFIADWLQDREVNRSILKRLESITLNQVNLLEQHEGKVDAGARDLMHKLVGLCSKTAIDQMKADIILLGIINENDMGSGDKEIKITREIID